MSTPLTPAEAEALAIKVAGQYLTDCHVAAGPKEAEQIGNYLMKLASVAGVLMAQAEGGETAGARLEGTARFIRRSMPKEPRKIVRL